MNSSPGNDMNFHLTPSAPQLVNPPPQIFGAYNPDGSPITPTLSAPLFGDETFNTTEENESGQGDPKRRRIARACDMCRKKKIKCDGKLPACTHCQNYKTECVFTQVEKKRQPPKGAKYIEGLENRLARMESLIRLSGLLNDEDNGKTDLGTLEKRLRDRRESSMNASVSQRNSETPGPASAPMTASATAPASRASGPASMQSTPQQQTLPSPTSGITSPEPPRPGARNEEEVEALSDMMCSLVTNNCGETRYIGSSSGFSIFSPKGIQWVNEKTGDTSFQDMISTAAVDENKWIHWKPTIFRDIFSRRVFKPLPPKDEALSLLKDYFENFNCMFPLFHEPTFMHLVDRQYSNNPYDGSGWWASLNVALAIAHRLRVMSHLVPQEEDQKAWAYLKNALAVQTELTIRNTDLLSVQALLGMALFLCGTPNPQPSFFLVAAAIRLAHSIGLHKKGASFNLSANEVEQRRRVFWIAYLLDKDISLRSGRPPIQDDDDMNVELPSEDPPDNVGNIPLADGKGKINLFRKMCTFSIIESKVYKQLYSVKASKQSDGELLNTIGELDRELEEWKDSIPIDFRPEHEIKASHTPLILHIVYLHFSYYNCLTTIHRMSVHHGYWTSRLSNYAIQGLNARPLNPRVFLSAQLCVQAARASIHLVKYMPPGDFACVWLIIYFPVSALVTLFANILQNPQDSRARSDIKLMNSVVNFLSMLCTDEENSSVKRMLSVCSEFERIAKVVLDRSEKESNSRRKRKQQEEKDKSNGTHASQNLSQQNKERDRSTSQARPTDQNMTPRSMSRSTAPRTPNMQNGTVRGSSLAMTPNFSNDDINDPSFSFSPFANPDNLHQADNSNHNNFYPDFTTGATPGPNGTTSAPHHHIAGGLHPGTAANHIPALQANTFDPDGTNDFLGGLGNTFVQPFVPQDLWQMPMTLEWDWADMTAYGGFEESATHPGSHADLAMDGTGGAAEEQRQQQQSQQHGEANGTGHAHGTGETG